jgi:cell division protein FtsL
VRLPAAPAGVHLPRQAARQPDHPEGDDADSGRTGPQPALAERQAARVAKGRVRGRGGRAAALLLVGFVLVATGVIWRRSYGFAHARILRDLERRRQALVAAKIQLEGAIRDASSRSRLEPIVRQRLQMHVPADSQIIYLAPPRPSAPRNAPQ